MPDFELERDPELVAAYSTDESSYTGQAEGVVRTGDPEIIAAVMAAASAQGVPVVFSARRTSLTGAAVPEGGWVVVLPEGSDPAEVEIDATGLARAPARVLVSDVEAAAEAAGWFLPIDPTSRKTCSIGGAVACNASGARSFGFGPTGQWVEGLQVVLASGERLHLRRGEHPPVGGRLRLALPSGQVIDAPAPPPRPAEVKSAMGFQLRADVPDIIDLFIGSEGGLGYLEAVELRLLPAQEIFAALVFWESEAQALDFVARLQSAPPAGLDPMSVEWFDREALRLAAAHQPRLKVPATAAAALFVEQRHPARDADAVLEAWYLALLEAGVQDDEACMRVARSRADQDAFRDFRHAVPESINALARQRGVRKLGTDLAYPRRPGVLHSMVAWYHQALADLPATVGPEAAAAYAAEWGRPLPQRLDHATFGHIGDNHLHLNLLPHDAAEAAAGRLLYDALGRHCAAHGGAISGEHGIGKAKRALLAELLPPARLAQMRAIKRAFDPAAVLCRGNVFSG